MGTFITDMSHNLEINDTPETIKSLNELVCSWCDCKEDEVCEWVLITREPEHPGKLYLDVPDTQYEPFWAGEVPYSYGDVLEGVLTICNPGSFISFIDEDMCLSPEKWVRTNDPKAPIIHRGIRLEEIFDLEDRVHELEKLLLEREAAIDALHND